LIYKSVFISMTIVLALGAGTFAAEYDASNFSADGRKWQPVPTGHIPGKDNGAGRGTHNAGEDCGICHRPDGKAPVIFTIAGTVYEDRAGRKPLQGGEIIVQDREGHVISVTSNEVGNFWTQAPISSNPYAIASHGGVTHTLYYTDELGFHPADPDDTRTWQYKAWVKSGNHVRHMVTIAPIGGSTDPASRMSCNMHHAAMGSRGGLWGMGKSTLASYPPARLSFKKHILPIFRNKCVPCHIPGATLTRLVTQSDLEGDPPTQIDHSKSLDLISYDGSSVTSGGATWAKRGIRDMTAGYEDNPDASPVLAKTRRQADGSVIHGGGAFWSATDPDYRAIRKWIAEGAQDN
jgi:hypothetical protein